MSAVHVGVAVYTAWPRMLGLWVFVAFTAPAAWLVVAGWLARGDTSPTRHAVTAAALLVGVEVVALVPAAAGWWQRRQERLADDAEVGEA